MLAPLRALGKPGTAGRRGPVPRVAGLDIDRYMGHWYVIALIPTRPERGASNAVECYAKAPDGTIETRFRYRPAQSAKVKIIKARGFVRPESGAAVWGMRFIWPFRAQYVIAWLDPDYQSVIVARDKRDHVWIMARTPTLAPQAFDLMASRVAGMGYELARLERVRQTWPEAPEATH
ncbi:hypothetical protein VI08_09345 [Luteibacter yeojuensis]|uniref:Outer membrane lipoprotein Blc n=1 Tax=Luteibacter yeojuensis TaxID=345309 RepID=A0A0F3KUB2_9GAMM|nr:hypothetical protein VI08_09345 [Luteibacter yeojuensis]